MNRRDRNRNEYEHDYGRYEGYNRNDTHYHSARNLTDTFEQEYQSHRGHRGDNLHRMDHTYHEGDMGDAYERYRREDRGYGNDSGNQRYNWDRDRNDTGSFGRDRDRYSNNWSDFQRDEDRYKRDQDYGNKRQGYGTSDRYRAYDRGDYRRAEENQEDYFGAGDYDRNTRYGSSNYSDDRNYSGGSGTRGGRRYGIDRDSSGDSWLDSNRNSYLQDRYY